MTKAQLNEQEAIWMPNQADKTLYDLYYLNEKKIPFKARKDGWAAEKYITITRMVAIMSKQAKTFGNFCEDTNGFVREIKDAEKPIWRIVEEIKGETIIEII